MVQRAPVLVLGLVNSWFLYSFAALWGQPSIGARYWAETYPESKRAISTLAMYRLEEEGLLPALQTIERFVTINPQHAYMRLQQLIVLCQYAPEQDHRWILEKLDRDLPAVDYVNTTPWMLYELLNTASRTSCNGVDRDTVVSLATTIRDNPRYTNEPLYNRAYQMLLADIAHQRGQFDMEIEHLQLAIAHLPTKDLNELMVQALIGIDDFAGAREFIDDAEARTPINPFKALAWRRDLELLREYTRQVEHEKGVPPERQMGGDKGQP
jgi:tetratricopeptide (TPR) repeat protein